MDYTPIEMMAVIGSRELNDGEIVFVGTGLPIVATFLAKKLHAPNLVLVVETGPVDPQPVDIPKSVADPRVWYKAVSHGGMRDVLGTLLQRGLVDVGFLGGAQIDKFGNLNSTVIGDYHEPKVRLPGSGGACDIAILAKRFVIITGHEKRKFPEKVDYITSPGHLAGGTSRTEAGIRTEGPSGVITDLAIMAFPPPSREMKIVSLHPNVTLEEVKDKTGFQIDPVEDLEETIPPTEEELEILRSEIDPQRIYLR